MRCQRVAVRVLALAWVVPNHHRATAKRDVANGAYILARKSAEKKNNCTCAVRSPEHDELESVAQDLLLDLDAHPRTEHAQDQLKLAGVAFIHTGYNLCEYTVRTIETKGKPRPTKCLQAYSNLVGTSSLNVEPHKQQQQQQRQQQHQQQQQQQQQRRVTITARRAQSQTGVSGWKKPW